MSVVVVIALRVAGLRPGTVVLGGAATAVVFGLAAQKTLANVIAGAVLLNARTFRVGERVRLQGGSLAGSVEGIVNSLGLMYTTLAQGADTIRCPTPSCSASRWYRCASPLRLTCAHGYAPVRPRSIHGTARGSPARCSERSLRTSAWWPEAALWIVSPYGRPWWARRMFG